jgi:GST-like protein
MQNTSDWIPKERHNAAAAEYAMTELKALLKILDGRLDGRAYITGDRFTLVDLDIASVLGWGLYVCKVDLSSTPNLQAWLGRVTQRPSFAAEQQSAH